MSKLETNTTSLQEILATVNALPEAGSGVKTCIVTIYGDQDILYDTYLSYTEVTDEGLNPVVAYFCAYGYDASTGSVTVKCALNTVLTLYSWNKLMSSASANDVPTANTADNSVYMFGLSQSAVSIHVY